MRTKYYQPEQTTPTSETTFWYKSPMLMSTGVIATISLAWLTILPWLTKPVLHIRAEDFSDSSMEYTLQRKVYCQTGSQNYQSGDKAVTIAFADHSVITKELEIENSLSMLGQCLKNNRPIKNIQPGTSLLNVLETGKKTIEKYHQENKNPVVFTILANAFEPIPGQKVSQQKINQLMTEISQENTIIALILPPETVNSDLINDLNNVKNIIICPMAESREEGEIRQSMQPCVEGAFAKARNL